LVEITSFSDDGLGNAAHVVDLGDGRAAVVDPPRHISPLRWWAEQRGRVLSHAFETHLHADFVSGSRELARLGATIVGPASAGMAFPHRGLVDGDDFDLGGLRMRAIATPGHAPEHMSYLVADGDRPVALFSGGALLPGGVARTDLIAPEQTEPLARLLYRVLHERILSLPDEVVVYPTHSGGSFCAAPGGQERITTIGRERASNPLLAARDEDAFVTTLLAAFGSYPTYFRRLREVNRLGPRVYGEYPTLARLSVALVERMRRDGAEIVDVRPIEAFAAGHVPGSLSIALRPELGSWLGWLVPADVLLVFVAEAEQDRSDLVRQAMGIGYENLAGELEGGLETWRRAGLPVATTTLTTTPSVGGSVLDVRQASEFRSGHVRGATALELGALAGAVTDVEDAVTVMCGHGERAMTAASLLERSGRSATVFEGGPRDWTRAAGEGLERAS
jgi:glyoxylase-like metal-dependent hydrolase (beta-lactamase superfamily II)/rhodanese-related sulfurtransferase